MSELPKGWVEVSLDKVANWGSGGTPKRNESSYYGGDIPWVKTGDLGPKYLQHSSEFITEEGLKKSSAKLFLKGSVAIAMYGATIGKTSILDFNASTNQACAVGSPIAGVTETNFLYYLLQNEKQDFIKKGKGGAQPNISQQIIKAHEIWFPPLAEQKRIVEKLDQVLAQVDTIKARLDGIPAILKRFHQSVLAAAVSGKLTEEWRGGDQVDYEDLKIEEIAIKQRYSLGIGPFGSNLKVDDYRLEGHPLVFVRDIRSKVFESDKTKFVSGSKFEELKAHRVKSGDILITKMGDPPGDVAIYPMHRPEAVITADCIKLTVNPAIAITKYVAYAMRSSLFQKSVLAISAGVAQQKVNLKKFRIQYIPVPSIEEQTEIVRLVDQYFAFADTIEQQVKKAQQRVDKLTQSILAKAFKGELVPQEHTLDKHYEPADQLLKRIAAARAESEALAKAAKQAANKTTKKVVKKS
ncbi:restriction endonuclease subunit S [Marinomonas sp. TI.3.20]|uniref:restriction endonuclease subunit S n=1 Tax=Marinomonas sp. TI.3.20 TaxID=3121296 RepID=UPI00311F1056